MQSLRERLGVRARVKSAIAYRKSLLNSSSSRAREAGSNWRPLAAMTDLVIAAALAVLAADLAAFHVAPKPEPLTADM